MKILAINGSPNPKSYTKEILSDILNNAQQGENIINLRNLTIKPCLGCRGCVKTNSCVQNDDWNKLESMLLDTELIILGFPTYYGAAFGINALTHSFLERWFALRHNGVKIKAKKLIAVIVSGEGHGQFAIQSLSTFLNAYHGMELVDSIIVEGATPCYLCGEGENCALSCVRAKHGDDIKITSQLIPSLEGQEALSKAKDIGNKIKAGSL
ncbi:multimeric flavodoxin WrbA [Clostridium aceticum]|uniref:Multimeric flavodoxin WrbA n=1 Tax=Clostridium aceticum TaxID=84022 RepID=A0A0D8IBM7_9CLOT|nr:flavodoxin family protein [Clostridium aceticum]AKL94751.1 multimeric flavodoxin WrbA [Clostridium aceticum]KJF27700.1 hypothetical protein TZ02_03560 [Clostridium aceticum]